MIDAIVLAAVLAAGPDVYIDEQGCRWRRPGATSKPTVNVQLHKPRPVGTKPRPKHKVKPFPRAEGDELLGCETPEPEPEDAAPEPKPEPKPQSKEEEAAPAPMKPAPVPVSVTPIKPDAPPTFEQQCDCTSISFWPVYVPGPSIFYTSTPLAPSVPEPQTWVLLIAGLGAVAFRSKPKKSNFLPGRF